MNDSPPPTLQATQTPKTHYLFLRILALVRRGPVVGISVREIAEELELDSAVVAHCIALHVHLERRPEHALQLPLPRGYWVPDADELIDRTVLDPPDARVTTASS